MHEPTFRFTAKEVNILVQALELAGEELKDYDKPAEIEALKEKLNRGGVK